MSMGESSHFKKIADIPEYRNIRDEVLRYEQHSPWELTRSEHKEQQHTQNISLRIWRYKRDMWLDTSSPVDHLKKNTYPHFKKTHRVMEDFAKHVGGTLSCAMIVSLLPHKQVYPHVDGGPYYKKRDRYHLVLLSSGSRMRSGGEEALFREGELWWFDNKTEHEAFNESDERRIHLIFDILPGRSVLSRLRQFFEKVVADNEQ